MESIVVLLIIVGFVIFLSGVQTVQQGYVVVLTLFGKYSRTIRAGLNFKVPLFEQVHMRISLQNQSEERQPFPAPHQLYDPSKPLRPPHYRPCARGAGRVPARLR